MRLSAVCSAIFVVAGLLTFLGGFALMVSPLFGAPLQYGLAGPLGLPATAVLISIAETFDARS